MAPDLSMVEASIHAASTIDIRSDVSPWQRIDVAVRSITSRPSWWAR
jgi:hypothetical protein